MWQEIGAALARCGTEDQGDMNQGLNHVLIEILTHCYQVDCPLSQLHTNFINIEDAMRVMQNSIKLFFKDIIIVEKIFNRFDSLYSPLVR